MMGFATNRWTVLAALVFGFASSPGQCADPARPPNVLLIVADDKNE